MTAMEDVKHIEWGPLPQGYAAGHVPRGVGIHFNDTRTELDITYSKTKLEPTWIDVLGLPFASAMLAYTKTDCILSFCNSEFFFGSTVIGTINIKVSDTWNEIKSRPDSIVDTQGDLFLTHPLLVKNTISFVGKSSSVWCAKVLDRNSGDQLIEVQAVNINFDIDGRKVEPLPLKFIERMLGGLKSRNEPNTKPSVPTFPKEYTRIASEQLNMTNNHIDFNQHVHYKVYIFLGFDVIRRSAAAGLLRHRGPEKSEDIVLQQVVTVFEQESLEGEVIRCDMVEVSGDECLYTAIYRGNTRLAYSQFTLKSSQRIISNL